MPKFLSAASLALRFPSSSLADKVLLRANFGVLNMEDRNAPGLRIVLFKLLSDLLDLAVRLDFPL